MTHFFMSPFEAEKSNPSSNNAQSHPSSSLPESKDDDQKERYFRDAKFLATLFVFGLLIVIAAYLQYSVYPSIMENDFGETQTSLHLSLLTYTINSVRCGVQGSCAAVSGLPAFDFVQLFTIVFILVCVHRVLRYKRK